MINIELTPQETRLVIYSLKYKAHKKSQSIRNLIKRREEIIDTVGENEFNHRVELREKTINNIDSLIGKMLPKLPEEIQKEFS